MELRQRLALRLVVVSAVVAGALGIVIVLSPDADTSRVQDALSTALTVGGAALIVVCLLGPLGRLALPLRILGGLTTLLATGSLLLIIWDEYGSDTRYSVFWASFTLATSLAQAALVLMALGDDRTSRIAKTTALFLLAVFTALAAPFLAGAWDTSDGFDKLLGTVSILSVIASLWVWARRLVVGARHRAAAEGLDHPTLARLRAAAGARGVTPSTLVGEALDAYLDS